MTDAAMEELVGLPQWACNIHFGTIFDFTGAVLEGTEDEDGRHPADNHPVIHIRFHDWNEDSTELLDPHSEVKFMIPNLAQLWSDLTQYAIDRDGEDAARSMLASVLVHALRMPGMAERLAPQMEALQNDPFRLENVLDSLQRLAGPKEEDQ